MPQISGDEVCKFVRSNPTTRDVPVVMLTASRTRTPDLVKAFENGANDYIVKPFVAEELRARVGTILRSGQLKRAADVESRRVLAISRLSSALLEAGRDVDVLLGELATVLRESFCDGCVISMPIATRVVRHSSPRGAEHLDLIAAAGQPMRLRLDAMTPAERDYARELDLHDAVVMPLVARGVADGFALLTREGASEPFDDGALTAIETCLKLAGLAIEAAARANDERAALRFQEQLVAIVSHDLRTPLSAMSMGIAMLRDRGELGASGQSVLARIENSTRRMSTIVEQLLDATRARIGQPMELERMSIDLRVIVEHVLHELRSVHPGARFELVAEPVEGHWDGDRLSQVVSNLASNAAQYGAPGATVTVLVAGTPQSATLMIRNANRSTPIPAAQLATLFDPFKRGEPNTYKHGLGLGLYIVNQIVHAHGGAMSATSTEQGTEFRVELPTAPA
jgi:phosphoserine phosphatase RsbU/P